MNDKQETIDMDLLTISIVIVAGIYMADGSDDGGNIRLFKLVLA